MTRPRVVLALIVGLVGSAGAVALGANSSSAGRVPQRVPARGIRIGVVKE